jgi:hypothetical protein
MAINFGVSEIHLSNGSLVRPPLNGITVFIGPNNSGKSVLLNEIVTQVSVPQSSDPRRWVKQIILETAGTAQDFMEWLHENGTTPRAHPHTGEDTYPGVPGSEGGWLTKSAIEQNWSMRFFNHTHHFLMSYQKTEDRLADRTSSQTWDLDFPPVHPSQILWDSREAQRKFSDLVRMAFGSPISINRYDQSIRLRVGEPNIPDELPPPSPELRAAYQALPTVGEHGDGFRSFVNILLHTLVRPTPVVVIDEPEAFLHPPQARLLGRFLAEQTPSPCQVFVATHSSDFLSGVMEASPSKPISLVRIARPNGFPTTNVLDPDEVVDILKTPLLRYSNIISGLFHDRVVLAEAEGDCQFYAATFDVIRGDNRHENLVFLHVNGKARLAEAARKLRQCGIPVAVIADIDLLNDARLMKSAVESLGGDFSQIEDDLRNLHQQMTETLTNLTSQQVRQQVLDIIGSPKAGQQLTTQQNERIAALLKSVNGWKQFKRSGLNSLSGTRSYAATRRLLDYLTSLGVFLVPVGELECWVPEVPSGNKSNWLTKVFEDGDFQRPSDGLREYVKGITEYMESTIATTLQIDPIFP